MKQVLAVDISDPNVYAPAAHFDTIGSIVSVIVQNAFVLAGVIAFILLVVGGFGMIVAAGQGDSKQTEKAKQTITGAAIGLIIIIGSFWIIQIVEKLTGLSLLPLQ